VRQGDRVTIHLTSLETTRDATHGFAIDKYNINVSLEPGESEVIEFVADQSGVFSFYCSEFCSALHLEMVGYLFVQP
jgi:nitrous-oxide reductase